MTKLSYLAVIGLACLPGWSQQSFYGGTNITGQLVLVRTVNVMQQAQLAAAQPASALMPAFAHAEELLNKPEFLPRTGAQLRAPLGMHSFAENSKAEVLKAQAAATQTPSPTQFLTVNPSTSFGFLGLTHYDQRNANSGNQFSIEPPSQGLAVANGYVVEGVNNAFQVYSTSGTPLLPAVISSNQLFGVTPAINRNTNIYGVYPTDMVVFYDQTINCWIVLQRAQDNDIFDNNLPTSHFYMAVSQTGDPTGTYNIYVMDTTDTSHLGCPCLLDYPTVGADQYGFYISSNEYASNSTQLMDANILAINKTALGSGAATPTVVAFHLPFSTGYEFTIHPATTPFGASYFVGNQGQEYFVSSQASFSSGNVLAVWAMTNTSSLAGSPSLLLTMLQAPALAYSTPARLAVKQLAGPLPYGSSLFPAGLLPLIDGGDNRIQSVIYSGGRLFTTFATAVADQNNTQVVGGAYVIFSPTLRGSILSAPVLRQGYIVVTGDHVLRPAIGVNSSGSGAIVFTLVGPDYYPSAAFVPINVTSTATAAHLAAAGAAPEDGFTGYPNQGFPALGTARWGDYAMAFAASDGSIWMGTEYIPNAPRTQFANWGTFIARYIP